MYIQDGVSRSSGAEEKRSFWGREKYSFRNEFLFHEFSFHEFRFHDFMTSHFMS